MKRHSLLVTSVFFILSCGGEGDQRLARVETQSSRGGQPDSPESFVSASVRLEAGNEGLLFGSGRITEVLVQEGESVRAGQSLVRLSGDQVLENALAAGRMEVEAAGAIAENSEREFVRFTELYEAGALSAEELEGVETAMIAARASFEAARADLTATASGRDAATIEAPFDGVVVRVWAREGDLAGSGPLVTLTGGDGFVVRALLPQRELGTIALGAEAWFETEAIPGMSFRGRVTSVSPGIDPVTCLLPVTVALDDPGDGLSSGLYGRIRISGSRM